MARNLTPHDGRGSCCLFDTCGDVCPSGARYSPDFTFRQLVAPKKIALHDRTLVRRLVPRRARPRIVAAQGYHQDRPTIRSSIARSVRRRLRLRLELASAAALRHPRFPNGIANSSGLVGRYMNGHKFLSATANIDDQTFSWSEHDALASSPASSSAAPPTSRSCATTRACGKARRAAIPRLQTPEGKLLLGDELMGDWRIAEEGQLGARCARTTMSTRRLRAG